MTLATCGRTSPTPFAYFDPESSCLRTSQGTLLLDSTPCSVTLPRSGSMRNGQLYERQPWEPATSEPGYSSLLPTPNVPTGGQRLGSAERQGNTWVRPDGSKVQLHLAEIARLLPTPTVGDSKAARNSTANRSKIPPTGIHAGDTLTDAVSKMLPTPRTSDANGGGHHGDGGPDLRTVVADTHVARLEGSEPAEGHVVPSWGDYEPAIRRHERALGRRAPDPTDERGRLAVPFVEWMQMLPEGHVDGLTRGQALRGARQRRRPATGRVCDQEARQ
jgi:hypothetical protein